ncbi:MAG: ABC transporter ATP-binding protein, partial [Gemmatimonadales bacterium]
MKPPPSSRLRHRQFVADYKARRLEDGEDGKREAHETGPTPRRPTLFEGKRGQYLRDYLGWLWPHRYAVAALFVLSLVGAAVQMVEPLFLRFMIDRVILLPGLDAGTRLSRLHLAGGTFVLVVIVSNLTQVTRDYRQRVLNAQVMLALRRALFDRLLRLPLPKLWEMKTGGILSRLTGDVDTTTGLLQMAIVSPALALIRLVIALVILLNLNWRLALTALAIIPGITLMSLTFSRRVRPIYRSLRKDVERIDGHVGETFSGIRVVRAFRGEVRELLEYLVGRHAVVRKELFAYRRELIIWTSWGLLLGAVNVVILWYGGYLTLQGRASVGDIMAFQWYTFLLLNPIWQIVNTFSELQRSLAATERVFEVLAMPDDKPDRPDAQVAPRVVNELRFDRVGFEYHEGRPVVEDFDVTVPGGSVVALVGRSGAGKTTVTDLVARFHDPTT